MQAMMMAVAAVVLIIAFAAVAMIIQIYNNLVNLKNQIERSYANIDVILKQRFDELPQLIQILEQFVQYEKGIIDRLVDARTRYGQASNTNEKVKAASDMSFALKGVFAIGENYPELKSNANFIQLQSRISALEDQIADRRENYNETVVNYNTRIEQIPDVIIAGMLGYKARELYKVEASEKVVPNLKMNLPNLNKKVK